MPQDDLRAAALALFEEQASADAERNLGRLEDARSPEHWAALCPQLTIGGGIEAPPSAPLAGTFAEDFARSGYCAVPSLVAEDWTRRVVDGIERIRDAGWPPTFAWVYDEMWSLAWASPVRDLAAALLGAPPLLIGHQVVHYVERRARARGWSPHRDAGVKRDKPRRVTTWFPFTDATLDNGCIYLLPRTGEIEQATLRWERDEATHEDVAHLLQHARALPAPAGSVLSWDFDVVHWGSVSREAPTPRVSVAFEWIHPDEPPVEAEHPLFDLSAGPPPFEQRLDRIAWSIQSYQGFDPAFKAFAAMADRLRLPAA